MKFEGSWAHRLLLLFMVPVVNRDARTIADKLEKTMQVTSEIQDRIEMNLGRKLELDELPMLSRHWYTYKVYKSRGARFLPLFPVRSG